MTQNRREILKSGLGGLSTALLVPGMGVRAALAQGQSASERRLVVVLLRGGLDGLAAVAPVGDPDYASVRGQLALPQEARLPLSADWGLHANLKSLKALYDQKQLAILHGVASPYRERSHFDAQNVMENGTGRAYGAESGWLNRALMPMGLRDATQALAVAQATPLILRGQSPVTSWFPSALPGVRAAFLEQVRFLYDSDPLLREALDRGVSTKGMAEAAGYDPAQMRQGMGQGMGQGGPQRAIASLAKTVGTLIAAPAGPRIAVIEIGGWDTHQGQGAAQGRLAGVFNVLDQGIAALTAALKPVWDKTAIIMFTEFGRTVAPNGTGGTDHGTASAAFAFGGAVAGGRVIADWRGLRGSSLYEGRDLYPTRDLRGLWKAALGDHLQIPRAQIETAIVPDSGAVAPEKDLFRA